MMDELEFLEVIGTHQRLHQPCAERNRVLIYLWKNLNAAEDYIYYKHLSGRWKPVRCEACDGWHITEKP